MKKMYEKLVRDKIPDIIRKDGEEPMYMELADEEFVAALFDKLDEEVKEMIAAQNNKKELIKEIGDVYEVIDAIIKAHGLGKAEIMELKNKRKKERGGFKEKIFLISSEKK